jgi:2-dehydro-3-deoxyphosphooctonate aldolase (KDO 8-P synthase)
MATPLFDPNKLLLIAGPCVIESLDICRQVAAVLAQLQQRYASKLTVVFKSSFDKANRTDIHSSRGMGLAKGLEILKNIQQAYHLPITTDIHEPSQAATVATVCTVIQIPAFLCRQTDLLAAAAATGRVVSVKKGQFLSPFAMRFVVEKLHHFKAQEIWLMERGTTFGYGDLVVDMRAFPILKETQCPVLFDATHSVQSPSCGSAITGGHRRYIQPLANAALAAGAQGLFVETHPDPANAQSDAATQLPLNELPTAVETWLALWGAMRTIIPSSDARETPPHPVGS